MTRHGGTGLEYASTHRWHVAISQNAQIDGLRGLLWSKMFEDALRVYTATSVTVGNIGSETT